MQRIRVELTGITALPGLMTFYSVVAVPSAKAAVETFLDAIKVYLPNPLTARVPNSGDLIEDSTGKLVGSWSEGSATNVTGTGAGAYAAGVGVRVQWNTNGIRNGRRVRGATFVCPLVASVFDSAGTIGSTPLTAIQTAADTLAADGTLLVWSRPGSPGGSDGDSNSVTSALVPDRITALRSRRY